jgi:hypothetical protein
MIDRAKRWLAARLLSFVLRHAPGVRPAPPPLFPPGEVQSTAAPSWTSNGHPWRDFKDRGELLVHAAVQFWRDDMPAPITVFSERVNIRAVLMMGLKWRPLILPAVNRNALPFGLQRH